MGKKKRSSQNSNNAVCQGDSSESESNNDVSQISEVSKINCNHFNKSSDINNLRRHFKSNKDSFSTCLLCKKGEGRSSCKDGWICLLCASYNCGENDADHKTEHFKTPHSDPHNLAYQLSSNTIWCFKCKQELPVDFNKRVQNCIDMVQKHCNDNLVFKPVVQDTGIRKTNSNDAQDYIQSGNLSGQPLQNSLQNKDIKPNLNLPKVRGLFNLGNTCFFNSVLQCLAQTPGLVSLLEEMDVPGERFHLELDGTTIDAELEKHKSSEVSKQLARVLTEVAGGSEVGDELSTSSPLNPRFLMKALTNKCPQFEGGDQHDAHELLRHLLDSVYKEDLKRYQAAILNHIGFYDEAKKNLDELDEEKKKFGKKLNQKVCDTIPIRPDHLFKGSLVSILQCQECKHESRREETFLDLSLPVTSEKEHPPSRRKQNNNNVEEFYSTTDKKHSTEEAPTMSKCQLNKQKRAAKRNLKNQMNAQKKEQSKGEPTIVEEDKKDSINGEQQTDADVEDNEDIACEEQDPKMEIVESGYSSEKQVSARGSPVTSVENQSYACDKPILSDASAYVITELPVDTEIRLSNRAESGLGSNQELTVAIPEENNPDCTSQESVRVNDSKGSPDISFDSQQGNFRNVDLCSEYQLPVGDDSNTLRRERVLGWNCDVSTNEAQSHSQDSSSASLSFSPGYTQENNTSDNISRSQSNEMSLCTSLPNSNDNMSICDSLPENVSLVLSSPNKRDEFGRFEDTSNIVQEQENDIELCSSDNLIELDSLREERRYSSVKDDINSIEESGIKNKQGMEINICSHMNVDIGLEYPKEENSGTEELINLRTENQKSNYTQISRSSPVEPAELTELDSGLLKLSLEGMTCAGDAKRRSSPVTTEEAKQPVYNDEGHTGFVLVGGVKSDKVPSPPPFPPKVLFTASYKFTHPEPAVPKYEPVQRYDNISHRYKYEEGKCSLQSCLHQFTTIEMLTAGNKVGCEACTERVYKGNKEAKTVYQHSSKQLLICKLPPIVIFHLKRFQVQRYSFCKISRHVDFPLILDISPFCCLDGPENRKTPILYSLYGVVEHSGTMHGGHYVAYVKVRSLDNNRPGEPPPGKWYYISDAKVNSIEESAVLSKQAYLLFYEKIL